ncbi:MULTISPECIES: glycine betaine uptake BCCT transporter [unclassified Acetobacterium]|jgi:glycine betaine transporter|uniref:glycine betaine uptake BCCT transporter n=1 Tax=unclassified Acetobacterium TaxID=2638182 RepID=UPI000DBEC0A5|nr:MULTISPECIES: BCCT family transporter [unclassified Acetobacterium]AWW28303.1 glycine/betaine ABC transporter permease [Acetobacterium sp. KB-1]MDZ5725044.1 BCCT family transporter [Acetobacterium sp. K1/6]
MVFYASLVFLLLFLGFGFLFPEALLAFTNGLFGLITNDLGWLYLATGLGILLFALFLAFGKYGKIRLGGDDDRPEYSNFSWFAMLFSAGMGIGLVFWGVAEPVFHYAQPPMGIEPSSTQSAMMAFRYTFLHWGFHPWAIYAIVGLALAYVTFRKKLPCLISSTLYPLLGEKIKGPIGYFIDTLALILTVIGVATSLGMGALQVNGGLNTLFNIPNTITTQVVIIVVITILFLTSAATGLNKGIKILSNTNIIIAVLLLLFVLIFGPTIFIIDTFFVSISGYIENILSMSLALSPLKKDPWIGTWTIFYWAWWLSWGPFVGTFIARISKGRTVREFVLGVVILPAVFCCFWFTVFGGTALYFEIFEGVDIVAQVTNDITVGLFATLAQLPLGNVISIIATLLIITFFVTSADSATFVIGMFARNGDLNPDTKIKMIWGILLSLIAIVLLFSGGLVAIRNTSIIMALPFLIIIILMCISLYQGLQKETKD